jgi:hypothetical protein
MLARRRLTFEAVSEYLLQSLLHFRLSRLLRGISMALINRINRFDSIIPGHKGTPMWECFVDLNHTYNLHGEFSGQAAGEKLEIEIYDPDDEAHPQIVGNTDADKKNIRFSNDRVHMGAVITRANGDRQSIPSADHDPEGSSVGFTFAFGNLFAKVTISAN